jgi:hypothetical protein
MAVRSVITTRVSRASNCSVKWITCSRLCAKSKPTASRCRISWTDCCTDVWQTKYVATSFSFHMAQRRGVPCFLQVDLSGAAFSALGKERQLELDLSKALEENVQLAEQLSTTQSQMTGTSVSFPPASFCHLSCCAWARATVCRAEEDRNRH